MAGRRADTDATALYASSWEALNAAARAAKAEVCGANTVHPSNPRMDGRTGCGIWVTDDQVAERMAEGLRLTGFDVVVLPGSSTGVVIRDAPRPAPSEGPS
jgi:hypothetical protein